MREVNVADLGIDFNFANVDHRVEMTYSPNFKYGHYKVNDGNATIAGFRVGDKLYFGISFCSPVDNFSKKFGRMLATDSLVYGDGKRRGVMVLDDETKELPPITLFKLALERHLNRMKNKPVWAKRPVVDFRPKKKFE